MGLLDDLFGFNKNKKPSLFEQVGLMDAFGLFDDDVAINRKSASNKKTVNVKTFDSKVNNFDDKHR